MPSNPNMVILLDVFGKPLASASNIGNDLQVQVTKDPKVYDEAIKGKPYASAPEWIGDTTS